MPYTVNVPLPGQILMKEVSSTVKPTSVSVMTGQKRDYFIESNKGLNLIFSPLSSIQPTFPVAIVEARAMGSYIFCTLINLPKTVLSGVNKLNTDAPLGIIKFRGHTCESDP